MTIGKIESWIEGSKFYHLEVVLRKLSIVYHLRLDILVRDKTIFTETIFYKVEGDPENLRNFVNDLQKIKDSTE